MEQLLNNLQEVVLWRCADLQSDPGELICLTQPSLRSLRRLFTAYCCYHKLRFENREEIDFAIKANDWESIFEFLIAYVCMLVRDHSWYQQWLADVPVVATKKFTKLRYSHAISTDWWMSRGEKTDLLSQSLYVHSLFLYGRMIFGVPGWYFKK